jgi:hypothetical protein
MNWVPRVHLTPAQLAIAGTILGAAVTAAAQAITAGGTVDWSAVVAAAATAGFAAWTQSHRHSDPGDTHV